MPKIIGLVNQRSSFMLLVSTISETKSNVIHYDYFL